MSVLTALMVQCHAENRKAYARLFKPTISHVEYIVLYVFEVLRDDEIEEFLAAFTARKEKKEKSLHEADSFLI